MAELTERFDAWMSKYDDPESPATPAATVILVRDGADGPEVLMVQRNATGSFADTWVFPGGKIDPEDYPAGGSNDIISASRTAAVREAQEEADIVVAADALVPLSHWIPPTVIPRRFATWFYLAPAPAGSDGDVNIDGGEIVDHLWVRPADALDSHAAGKVELMPPTWLSLHDLAPFDTAATALRTIAAEEFRFYCTRRLRTEPPIVCWPEDSAFDNGDPTGAGPRHRITLSAGGWKLERDF